MWMRLSICALILGIVTACAGGGGDDGGGGETDLCANVTCPDQETSCDGNTVVTQTGGACNPADGTCGFASAERDNCIAGEICDNGACVAGCDDASCTNPPASDCDGDSVVSYASSGACDDAGDCGYESTVTPCNAGEVCEDGACVSTCDDASCTAPPAGVCDGNQAVNYAEAGSCDAAGECAYEETRVDCEAVPGSTCQDEGTVLSYSGGGVCGEDTDGAPFCDYSAVVEATACDAILESCAAGACERDCTTCLEGVDGSIAQACTDMNKACGQGATDCSATCDVCLPGFKDGLDSGEPCVAVASCDDAGCSGQNRDCSFDPTGNVDAVCTTCSTGYEELDDGSCVALPTFSCEDGADGPVACLSENRECDEAAEACGGCLADYVENPSNECEAFVSCEETSCATWFRGCTTNSWGNTECGDCLEGAGENVLVDPSEIDPNDEASECIQETTCDEDDLLRAHEECADTEFCVAGACVTETPEDCDPLNQYFSVATGCTDCGCELDGQTGGCEEVASQKICITEGEWFETVSGETDICDEDGDGWVKQSAYLAFVANIANAEKWALVGCADMRTIASIVLRNDQDDSRELTLSSDVPLFEPDHLDSEDELTDSTAVPGVPFVVSNDANPNPDTVGEATSKLFTPGTLNSLTKACWSPRTDLNGNTIPDWEDHQGSVGDPATGQIDVDGAVLAQAQDLFTDFSYYVELHHGYYEETAEGAGRYVIAEKARTDAGFLFEYQAWASGGATNADDYWKTCDRQRDPEHAAESPVYTTDFGRWATDDFVMGHHTQFQCRAFSGTNFTGDLAASDMNTGNPGRLHANDCGVALDSDRLAESASGPSDLVNPEEIEFVCDKSWNATASTNPTRVAGNPSATITSSDGAVVWISVGYRHYGLTDGVSFADDPFVGERSAEYAGGCVNEGWEYPERCAGGAGAFADGDIYKFGELICGCKKGYADKPGPGGECGVGCPRDPLTNAGFNTALRKQQGAACDANDDCTASGSSCDVERGVCVTDDIWMCGTITASSTINDNGGPFLESTACADDDTSSDCIRLAGRVPVSTASGTIASPACAEPAETDDDGNPISGPNSPDCITISSASDVGTSLTPTNSAQ